MAPEGPWKVVLCSTHAPVAAVYWNEEQEALALHSCAHAVRVARPLLALSCVYATAWRGGRQWYVPVTAARHEIAPPDTGPYGLE